MGRRCKRPPARHVAPVRAALEAPAQVNRPLLTRTCRLRSPIVRSAPGNPPVRTRHARGSHPARARHAPGRRTAAPRLRTACFLAARADARVARKPVSCYDAGTPALSDCPLPLRATRAAPAAARAPYDPKSRSKRHHGSRGFFLHHETSKLPPSWGLARRPRRTGKTRSRTAPGPVQRPAESTTFRRSHVQTLNWRTTGPACAPSAATPARPRPWRRA
jgi:hypothetical protein